MKYATAADFAEIFADEMRGLFLLALLLTADMEKAEECFISGLEECVDGMDSFLGWARSWARRSIVKRAIRIVAPARSSSDMPRSMCLNWPADEKTINLFRRLMSLSALERFAFVLSLLERQSDQDCSLLLGCRRQEFEAARTSAMHKFARLGAAATSDDAETAWQAWRQRNTGTRPAGQTVWHCPERSLFEALSPARLSN